MDGRVFDFYCYPRSLDVDLICFVVCMADTVIKQQLSSLYYLRTVCDTRQQLLNDGVADTDNVLPGVCI